MDKQSMGPVHTGELVGKEEERHTDTCHIEHKASNIMLCGEVVTNCPILCESHYMQWAEKACVVPFGL